jgi:hypothetical protein
VQVSERVSEWCDQKRSTRLSVTDRQEQTCLGLPEKGDSPRLGGISSMSGLMNLTNLSSMASYSG